MVCCTEGSLHNPFIAARQSIGKLSSSPMSSWFAIIASCFCEIVSRVRWFTYRVIGYQAVAVLIVEAEIPHLLPNNFERNHHVGEDDLSDLFALVSGEAVGVNETHLLEDRRLAGLSGAWSRKSMAFEMHVSDGQLTKQ